MSFDILPKSNLQYFLSKIKTKLDLKVDKVSGKGLSANDYTTTEKNKLSGISAGAEVNQNAFSNVKVGSKTIAADSKTDQIEFSAGSNVTLSADTANDKITIAASSTLGETVKQVEVSSADTNTYPLLIGGSTVLPSTINAQGTSLLNYRVDTKTLTVDSSLFQAKKWTQSTGAYISSSTQLLVLAASNENDYRLKLGVFDNVWSFAPTKKDMLRLGTANYRWNQIYSNSASISTSDKKEKKNIKDLDDFSKDLIMALKPKSFKFKNGESGRTHYGLIAQDVEDTLNKFGLTTMDCAAVCKDLKIKEEIVEENGEIVIKEEYLDEYIYGLRYEELIAPMIKTIQLMEEEISLLKSRIDLLENK